VAFHDKRFRQTSFGAYAKICAVCLVIADNKVGGQPVGFVFRIIGDFIPAVFLVGLEKHLQSRRGFFLGEIDDGNCFEFGIVIYVAAGNLGSGNNETRE